MRIGLISDIHGNFTALEAILSDMNRQPVDSLICLGDIATIGPEPKQVFKKLMSLDCTFIMGNHDSALLDTSRILDYQIAPNLISTVEWCAQQLDQHEMDFLHSFKPTAEVSLDGQLSLLFFHGSPLSNTRQILATTPAEELDKIFNEHAADVFIGGHTHIQMVRQHNGKLILNPGSVGTPFRSAYKPGTSPVLLPWAEYAVLNSENGSLSVDMRRVPYNTAHFKETVKQSRMPLPELWF